MLTVYLSGPMAGLVKEEAEAWMTVVEAILKANFDDCTVIKPIFYEQENGRLTDEHIVEQDKKNIRTSDLVIANPWQPSVGTAMEVMYAHMIGLPVIILRSTEHSPINCWYYANCFDIVVMTEEAICQAILELPDHFPNFEISRD